MTFVLPKSDIGFHELMSIEIVRRYFISDILGIHVEEIKSIRLKNPFLRRVYKKQKQGILDVLLEVNDESRINIEMQLRMLFCWDKRILFYLAKVYTDDLIVGENYQKLKKCISISILDYNLDDSPKYHRVYKLRDENGQVYSDIWEVHIIELNKVLNGQSNLDSWIQLFNAKSKEDLEMIKINNKGIAEAVRFFQQISLTQKLRIMYEQHLKYVRDQNAIEEYMREQAKAADRAEVLLHILNKHGHVSSDLRKHILSQDNPETLITWIDLALGVKSIQEFAEGIQQKK